MDSNILHPIQCTGCEGWWDDWYLNWFCDGDLKELEERHKNRYCWQHPQERYKHILIDIREPMDLAQLRRTVILDELLIMSSYAEEEAVRRQERLEKGDL